MTIEAGTVSLGSSEPSLQTVDVFSIQPYRDFEYVTGLHNIALLQVTTSIFIKATLSFWSLNVYVSTDNDAVYFQREREFHLLR